ncbi:MAG: hypothetical protein B7Z34_04480 [Novosphingobium sp. 12-62-10]|nr:MAG: hypothetical protein B7Z34_04480 [Novosphingobium sp. 12-62-10]
MAHYKEPDLQDRRAAAARARDEALAKLKARKPVDPAIAEAKIAALAAKEAAALEKRRLAKIAAEEAKAAKIAEAEAAAAAIAAKQKPELTEAEKKAARDARYAARKQRKS